MGCEELQNKLHLYVDDELTAAERRQVEAHLEDCAECRRLVKTELDWQQAIRRTATYHRAPEALRRRVAEAAAEGHALPAPPARRSRSRQGWAMAASLLVAVALSSSVTAYLVAPSPETPLARELVADHVRSLMADHLTDVASSDQHTVKPWFDGRLDYAPPVEDFAADGFPLVGGRLDYVDHRTVAALVYRRAKHPINLFVFPARGGDGAVRASVENGYNILRWTQGGMEYWAISDVNPAELRDFVALVRRPA